MMKDQLVLTASADSIASEKYQIAKEQVCAWKFKHHGSQYCLPGKRPGKERLYFCAARFLGRLLSIALFIVI